MVERFGNKTMIIDTRNKTQQEETRPDRGIIVGGGQMVLPFFNTISPTPFSVIWILKKYHGLDIGDNQS